MQCREFEALYTEAADGVMAPAAAAHMGQCEACQALVMDLETIHNEAHRLLEAGEDPPERVWQKVRAQLEADGIIRGQKAVVAGSSWTLALQAWLVRPALVATYAAFLLLAGGLVWQQSGTISPARPEPLAPEFVAMQRNLNGVETQAVKTLEGSNSGVDASLRRNLAIVDNFIALCEKNVREEPRNDTARQYLFGAYQQKAQLLATVIDHGWSGE
ncbi:MAG: hypothetical protein ACRD5L_03640 [Bryobacteraceae bacterium]